MRLSYTVLCVDDNIGTLRDTKRNLTRHNESVGIETQFVDVSVVQAARGETDLDVFRARIFSEIASKFKEYQIDLVMVDLHLGVMKGHEVIDHIRHNQTMYRPIVFYSGGEGEPIGTPEEHATQQLHDGLRDHKLVGKSVFISVRGDNLIKDLRGICSEMHEEEHKLNASRGLLMDRTSEIDARVLKHLRKRGTWEFEDDKIRNKIQKAVLDEIARQEKNAVNNASRMKALAETGYAGFVDWICGAAESDVLSGLSAFPRNKLMREILRVAAETKESGEVYSTYFNPQKDRPHLTGIRDAYAHQTEEQIGEGHNNEKCKFIREEIRIHLKNVAKVTS